MGIDRNLGINNVNIKDTKHSVKVADKMNVSFCHILLQPGFECEAILPNWSIHFNEHKAKVDAKTSLSPLTWHEHELEVHTDTTNTSRNLFMVF